MISLNYIKKPISNYEYFITFLLVVMCGFTSGDIIPAKSYFLSFMCLLYINKKENKQSIKKIINTNMCLFTDWYNPMDRI